MIWGSSCIHLSFIRPVELLRKQRRLNICWTLPLISFLCASLSFWTKVSSASSSSQLLCSTSALITYLWFCERIYHLTVSSWQTARKPLVSEILIDAQAVVSERYPSLRGGPVRRGARSSSYAVILLSFFNHFLCQFKQNPHQVLSANGGFFVVKNGGHHADDESV